MKLPSTCPKCHDPLINTPIQTKGISAWKRVCDTKLNHSFVCIIKDEDDSVLVIGMTLNRSTGLKVFWDFARQRILVHKGESHVPFPADNLLQIPWFEPNINEYDKLIDKIKKYVTFS